MQGSLPGLWGLVRGFLFLAALALGGWAQARQPAPPKMFSYQPTGTAADAMDGVPASLNLAGLGAVPTGGLVDFTTPDGRSFPFVFGGIAATRTGGAHWIGHLDADDGDGEADILWQHRNTTPPTTPGNGQVVTWLMNGIPIGSSGSPNTVADLNWTVQNVR